VLDDQLGSFEALLEHSLSVWEINILRYHNVDIKWYTVVFFKICMSVVR